MTTATFDQAARNLDLCFREMAPGLGDDSVLPVVGAEPRLLEEWLELNLVDGGTSARE